VCVRAVSNRQRPYSIRTRIKTCLRLLAVPRGLRVRDHIPLEQGLRLNYNIPNRLALEVRDHIPLEQGLRPRSATRPARSAGQRPYSIRTRIKTCRTGATCRSSGVRDHIPLEQGLRRSELLRSNESPIVRDHIPLEQGLRHKLSIIPIGTAKSEPIFH